MKRLTALLIALVLLIIPVSATSGSFFDYTDDILEDGSLIYYFQEMSLQLPADWRGKVMAEQVDGGVNFYQKSSHEKYLEEGIKNGGFLFQLAASVNQSFTQLPAFKYVGFCESSAMNYYLRLPTDYPAYNEPSIREEYDKMAGQIDYVVEHAKFYENSGGGSSGQDSSSAGITSGPEGRDSVPPEGGTASGGSGSPASASAWTPQEVRYSFEHSMMPQYFYDRPESLLKGIYQSGLYPLWEAVCKENDTDPFYPAEDYRMHWYSDGENIEFVQLEMPAPDATTLCYRVYLVCDFGKDFYGYYTVESNEFAPDMTFICTWSKDREHSYCDAGRVLDPKSSTYSSELKIEADKVAAIAGITADLKEDTGAASGSKGAVQDGDADSGKAASGQDDSGKAASGQDAPGTDVSGQDAPAQSSSGQDTLEGADAEAAEQDLQVITCPQLGFSVQADKSYEWDYQVGTGISIYTDIKGSIPYVIVYQGEDLIGEPFEYIKEQFTPHIQKQYGADLISYEEDDAYQIGGKKLPAGLYTYRLQEYEIQMLRLYDSTEKRTVAYTAKYVKGQGDATLKALDTAIRTFEAAEDPKP